MSERRRISEEQNELQKQLDPLAPAARRGAFVWLLANIAGEVAGPR